MDAEQRHRVCRIIAGLVVADSDLAPEEDAFIDRMLEGFGIPNGERESIFPILDRDEAAAEIKDLAPELQQEALSLLLGAAVADGQIVDEERDYIRAVGAALGLDAPTIDRRLADALAARAKA